jgi:hypothetical protein
MAVTFRNVFATFEAREVEAITGVPRQTQRDWRHRGFFERAGEGRADHDTHDLARFIVMRALADRGIGPSVSSEIAASAALRIEFFALNSADVIDDKTGGELERFMKLRKRPLASAFVSWTDSPNEPSRYLVIGDDGLPYFTNDIREVFSERSFGFAAIMLDLKTLGTSIAKRAGRPLVTVKIKQTAHVREKAAAK